MKCIIELLPIVDKFSEDIISELNIYLINSNLSKEDRKRLVDILVKI